MAFPDVADLVILIVGTLCVVLLVVYFTMSPVAAVIDVPQNYSHLQDIAVGMAREQPYSKDNRECIVMSLDLADRLNREGYRTVLMVGNIDGVDSPLVMLDHIWVMAEVRGQYVAIEATSGQVKPYQPEYYSGFVVRDRAMYENFFEKYLIRNPPDTALTVTTFPVPEAVPV